ncbi:MAG: type 4a pilus biogenesis protein PilO [Acidobacteria bacterium]|nr:type 4a pilus biogenesis protein PilO [Acidobacteriota bacterium]
MAAAMASVQKTEEGGNFFSRMAWYYQTAILLALVVILIYAADAMMFSDKRTETAKIDSQAQTLKAKNAQASIIRQNLAAAEETLHKKQQEMDGLRDLLPDQVEISRIYDNIKDMMKEQKLELKKFMPSKATPAEIYTAQPIQIEITGSYDNLGLFLSQLGFYRRILSVTDLDIKQAEDNAQYVGRSINGSFVVTAFFIAPENLAKLTKPAAAPAPAPGAPPAPPK